MALVMASERLAERVAMEFAEEAHCEIIEARERDAMRIGSARLRNRIIAARTA